MPICALCQEEKELKNSHTIPRSIFKNIYTDSGKGILISARKDVPNQQTQEQMTSYLLCNDCEQFLSKKYEKYTLEALRGQRGTRSIDRLSNMDFNKVELFFISLIWRAAVSPLPYFNDVNLKAKDLEVLRNVINDGVKLKSTNISVKLSRLSDKKEELTEEGLKRFVMGPFKRRYKKNYSFHLILLGFFIEIFVPRLNHKERKKAGVLESSKNSLSLPEVDLFSIPELFFVSLQGLIKSRNGQHTLKEKDWGNL